MQNPFKRIEKKWVDQNSKREQTLRSSTEILKWKQKRRLIRNISIVKYALVNRHSKHFSESKQRKKMCSIASVVAVSVCRVFQSSVKTDKQKCLSENCRKFSNPIEYSTESSHWSVLISILSYKWKLETKRFDGIFGFVCEKAFLSLHSEIAWTCQSIVMSSTRYETK